jgi:O-antigen/teichoic acid export membrane protein
VSGSKAAHNAPDGAIKAVWSGAVRGVRDNALAEVAMQVIKLGGFVVLARALMPSDFGIFRVTAAITSFALPFAAAGLADSLVQRRALRADLEATGFWVSALAGIAVAMALWAAAPWVAIAMRMPPLGWALRIICIPIVIEAIATLSTARLRRELRFGPLATADVLGEAAFFGTAIAMVIAGRPRVSLVLGLGARMLVHGTAVYVARPIVPRFRFSPSADRDLIRFSSSVVGGQALRTVSANADFMMVGWLLGSTQLGFYSMAWDLLRFVPDRVYAVAGRVALPAFCRLQDNDAALREGYRAIVNYAGRFVIPMGACAAVAAPKIIAAIYGPAWAGTAMPLRLMSFGLAMIGLRMVVGSIYYAKDHPGYEIMLQGARGLAVIVTVGMLAHTGLIGVSLGMSLLEGAMTLLAHEMVCRLIGLDFRSLVRDGAQGLRCAVWCALATFAGTLVAEAVDLHGPAALPVVALLPTITFAWLEFDTASQMLAAMFAPRPAALRTET